MIVTLCEYAGLVLGLVGAWLVAGRGAQLRQTGFAAWIVSNLAWIVWAAHAGAWGLLTMQAFFLVTSIRGWLANGPGAGR